MNSFQPTGSPAGTGVGPAGRGCLGQASARTMDGRTGQEPVPGEEEARPACCQGQAQGAWGECRGLGMDVHLPPRAGGWRLCPDGSHGGRVQTPQQHMPAAAAGQCGMASVRAVRFHLFRRCASGRCVAPSVGWRWGAAKESPGRGAAGLLTAGRWRGTEWSPAEGPTHLRLPSVWLSGLLPGCGDPAALGQGPAPSLLLWSVNRPPAAWPCQRQSQGRHRALVLLLPPGRQSVGLPRAGPAPSAEGLGPGGAMQRAMQRAVPG